YNNNPQKASTIYGITTLLCMFTMPLVIALYQIWG
ncbi:MAG: AEC family transporter, partial [Haemophilus sp.]|nr:AEC family transporter [Haemophilus sp.]